MSKERIAMKSLLILVVIAVFCTSCSNTRKKETPNILLITLDDMNWNSVGVYGCEVPDISPHIDQLAESGIRFNHAYVQASNCSPSRCVLQSGRYPHQTGMRGFYYVDTDLETLPEILRDHNYITGALNKVGDSSLDPDFQKYWDYMGSFTQPQKRSSKHYGQQFSSFLSQVDGGDQPFYCVVNIADPHKPFFNDEQSKQKGFDVYEPSLIFSLDDVEIPGFLPNAPKIKQDVLNYHNSVKRGDDCVGAILDVLDQSSYSGNTIVMFLSDHGMPMPFAKSSVYENGIRTPWIVSWPGEIKSGDVDSEHLISSIDFAPTIMDILEIDQPEWMEGRSFFNRLKGKSSDSNPYVFAQFDENAGGIPRPSRTVLNGQYGYIFNAWATGKYRFKSAAQHHLTYRAMWELADFDASVKMRLEHWDYRSVEELYDYENDPDALKNLIDEPGYQEVTDELRKALEEQMEKTNDYLLPAFLNRDNLDYLNQWMEEQDQEAILRSQQLQWKRYTNRSGSTESNVELYKVN